MDTKKIQQSLEKFNLTKEEASVYIHLLKLGESSIATLALTSQLKRPSTYNYIEALIKKGLADWKQGTRGKIVIANDPRNLQNYLNEVHDEYKQLQNEYYSLLPALDTVKAKKTTQIEVKQYNGVEGLQIMITSLLQTPSPLYIYLHYEHLIHLEKEILNLFKKRLLNTNVPSFVIANNETMTKKYIREFVGEGYKKINTIRILTREQLYIPHSNLFYSNIFAIIHLETTEPHVVEILNEDLVKMQISLFKMLWEQAKTINWER